ncbi:MAG: YqcC family protein [Anaerolineae bacterium]
MPPSHTKVASVLDSIEAELKRIGYWQDTPLQPEQYDFRAAFAMDTMAYNQWLQFVFIPRVRSIIAAQGQFPASSSVGTQAVREFDGNHEAARLVILLSEFDALFG